MEHGAGPLSKASFQGGQYRIYLSRLRALSSIFCAPSMSDGRDDGRVRKLLRSSFQYSQRPRKESISRTFSADWGGTSRLQQFPRSVSHRKRAKPLQSAYAAINADGIRSRVRMSPPMALAIRRSKCRAWERPRPTTAWSALRCRTPGTSECFRRGLESRPHGRTFRKCIRTGALVSAPE